MKIHFASSIGLLVGVVNAAVSDVQSVFPSVRRRAQECDTLVFDYGDGTDLSSQKADGTFKIPADGSFRCNLSCDSGEADVFVKFGTSGASASASNFDVKEDSASGCNHELDSPPADDRATVGIKYTVNTQGAYTNLKIRCTCYEESSPPPSGGGCFSGDATVQVEQKGLTAMKDLQMGDYVLTDAAPQKYEPVYSFGHYEKNWDADFIQLKTAQTSLELTANHLVYLHGQRSPIRADKVQVGDAVQTTTTGSNHVVVTKISMVQKRGLYMPLTPSGKIVVNGILSSSYVSIEDDAPAIVQHPLLQFWLSEHMLSHLWMAPFRMLCMGVSSKFCVEHPRSEEGILDWLLTGQALAKWANNQSMIFQVPIGVLTFVALVGAFAAETVFGAAFAPLALLAVVALAVRRRRLSPTFSAAKMHSAENIRKTN